MIKGIPFVDDQCVNNRHTDSCELKVMYRERRILVVKAVTDTKRVRELYISTDS